MMSSTPTTLAHNTVDTATASAHAIGKVVCVGRNYAAHARELGNEVPTSPLLFMKPASSVVFLTSQAADARASDHQGNHIVRPDPATFGETHYEAELCIQLSADLVKASPEQAKAAIGGVSLGLDLTLRALQSQLKAKGHPWERAKCFDGACVLGEWVAPAAFGDFTQVHYQLHINDKVVQDGDTSLMLFSVYELLADICHAFSLQAADVIMTGTPSGVGVLQAGDVLTLKLGEHEWGAQVR